uniref:Late embryogenesis abundant protein LEA-2 subgroup domain-containing protein n=1 Tax=Oryza punctata TaxID=4537 RepID=A0A0E0LJ02_ORYPU
MGVFDDGCGECCYNWKDFCWCLLCIAILLAIALIVVLVVAFGFVVQPSITVDDASLTRLALVTAPTTALAYNLSLLLTLRNRNWAMSMKNVEPLEAAYRFDGQQFDRIHLADKGEKQGPKKTVVYRLSSGSDAAAAPGLGNAGVAEFKKENDTGTFEVEVGVTGKVSYTARITKCKIEATCKLKLQLAPPGQAPPAVVFQKVKCKLAKAEKNC